MFMKTSPLVEELVIITGAYPKFNKRNLLTVEGSTPTPIQSQELTRRFTVGIVTGAYP